MKNYFLLLACIYCLLLFPAAAGAHSHLESSTPADGETVEEPLDTLELQFDAGIEPLSTIQLFNENEEEVPVEDISIDSPVLTASLAEPLANGQYRVTWTIIGADTHTTEGEFSFSVDAPAPENEAATEEQDAPVTEEPETEQEETIEEETAEPELATADEEEDPPAAETIVPLLTTAVVIILFGALAGWLVRRRK
ncbi:copper resistance CopC family protein [Halalkalibacter oceani]|uniref:copper resistance CopC family protein n=1 Tax=Halalkalibacter oceani TaxID=1653776 RepID=UPI0033914B7D